MSTPIIYFTDNKHLDKQGSNSNDKKSGEKIKLEFSIINPSNAIYLIQAKLYDNQVLDYNSEVKTSNVINKLIFEKFLLCEFFFERQQNLIITLKKNNYQININTTLGSIIGINHCTFKHKINENEYLMIKAENVAQIDESLKIDFSLKEKNSSKNFFVENKYLFIITNNSQKLYQSEYIHNNGAFNPINIPIALLKPYYTINFYNSRNQLIATINETLTDKYLQKNKPSKLIPINNYLFLYDNSTITKKATFIDYINAGVKIALSIGIDFTGSNGHPLDDGTLHSIKDGKPNDYEKAIISCGNIVAPYDYDQLFQVYGFGAIIKSSISDKASMCFAINLKDNPDIYTIDNVIKTYHDIIKKDKLTFAGPTEFTPIIKKVISRMITKNILEYHILMILTDGVIDDLQDTIDILVEASSLPLSVIIIGIGNEDFSKMEVLDGDEVPLKSRNGKIRTRDIVQFVPFSKFQNDAKKLSMEVLAEIPRQMIEYFQFKNLSPNKLKDLIQQDKIQNIPQNPINNNKVNNYQQGNNTHRVFIDNVRQNPLNQNNNINNRGNMTQRNYQNKNIYNNNKNKPNVNNNAINNNNNLDAQYDFFKNKIDLDALPENKTIYLIKK